MEIKQYESFDNSFFEQFLNEDIADIFDRYRTIADEKGDGAFYACFMLSLSCLLCKDIYNAELWRDRFRDIVLRNRDRDISIYGFRVDPDSLINEQFRSFRDVLAAADAFLDVQIACFRLDFASAGSIIDIGMTHAGFADSGVFMLFFLVFSGWHYRYMNHNGFADARFIQAVKYVSQRDEFQNNKFYHELAQGCQKKEEYLSFDPWVQFYNYEIGNVCSLATKREFDYTPPECYATLFKNTSRVSRFEKILSTSAGAYADRDFSQLSLNQRLYCEIHTKRPVTFKTLNADSLIIAADDIMDLYEKKRLNFEQVSALENSFSTYLDTLFYQLDLTPFASLIPEWIKHNHGKASDIIIRSGSNLYMDAARKEMFRVDGECMFGDIEVLLKRYRNNLKLLLNLKRKGKFQLFDYQVIAIASVWSILGTVSDDEIIEYISDITSSIAALIDEFNTENEYKLKELRASLIELYKNHIKWDSRSKTIFDHPSVMSIIIELYKKNHEETKSILRTLDYDVEKLKAAETFALNALLTEQYGWEIEDYDKTSRIWILSHEERSTKILYLIDDWGCWDPSYLSDASRDWKSGENLLVSPVNKILQLRKDSEAEVIAVLMSGVSLESWGTLKDIVDKDKTGLGFISITTLYSLLNSSNDSDFSIGEEDRLDKSCLKYAPLSGTTYNSQKSVDYDIEFDTNKDTDKGDWDIRSVQVYLIDNVINDFNKDHRIKNFGPVRLLDELLESYCGSGLEKVYYTIKFGNEYKNSINIGAEISEEYNIQEVGINNDFRPPFESDNGPFVVVKISNKYNEANLHHYLTLCGKENIKDFKECLENELNEIIGRYNKELKRLNSSNVEELLAKGRVIAATTKAAKTAIMARNMSHNLGSHVLAYLKEHLKSVKEMTDNYALYEVVSKDGVRNPKNCDVALPFMVGLGRFMSYLQERQDFIADIATAFFPTCMTLNFKDDIYDILNIDKRSERHPDRKGEKPDNILLGNIARSESFFRKMATDHYVTGNNDLVLNFGSFDGSPVEPIQGKIVQDDINRHYGETLLSSAIEALDHLRNINVSIPGGVVGRHALFSIIENIIRNSAKHGKPEDELRITLDVYDKADYAKRASDEDCIDGELSLRGVFEKFYENAQDADDLYFVTITDNCKTDYDIVKYIREKLIEGYVDKEGKMREDAKGIKEMRICASWLRLHDEEYYPYFSKYNLEQEPLDKSGNKIERKEILHDTGWPENKGPVPTLYVRSSGGHLQYIIALRKPLKVLLISDRYDEKLVEKCRASYWRIMSSKHLESSGLNGCDYDFILIDGDEDIYNKVRPKVSMKILRLNEIHECADLIDSIRIESENGTLSDLLNDTYDKLLEIYSDYEEGDVIRIDDDKVERKYAAGLATDVKDRVLFDGYGDSKYKYWYRTHYGNNNDSDRDRLEFRDDNDEPIVDGISGGNSTDRLVRCEQIDKRWFWNHLHAFKQRVAVFDERLSYKIYGIDGSDFKAGNDSVSAKKKLSSILKDRNVWLFNVVQVAELQEFIIYGMKEIWCEKEDNYKVECVKVASVSRSENDELLVKAENGFRQKFDIISIHQGLLDKLYTGLKIEKEQADKKEQLTKALHEFFCDMEKRVPIEIDKGKSYYLPGLVIHSGRSKPADVDMPQKQPFIQYASLEHAVLDCKFVLVDLLERAYYE